MLPADKLHCFNFITMSFKREYLKLNIFEEVVPAYSNVTKPIYLTSGCFIYKNIKMDYIFTLFHLFINDNQAL